MHNECRGPIIAVLVEAEPDRKPHHQLPYCPLISLYLFIPIISPWLRKATPGEELFFIAVFLVTTTIPYLNHYCGDVWGQCFWNEFHALWYFSGFIGYLVIAHYIHHHLSWSSKRRFFTGLVAFIAGSLWSIMSFYNEAIPGTLLPTPEIELGWRMCTTNVALATIGAFLMMSCIRRGNRVIEDMAKMSFGIYLMHLFFVALWVPVLKSVLPTAVAIPTIAVVIFITCYIVTKILSYIPGSYWFLGVDKK